MTDGSVKPAALILSGGLGLGAYQAGALSVLLQSGRLSVEAVAGASIGAVNGAILAGNPPEQRVERLNGFWSAVATEVVPEPWFDPLETGGRGPARHLRNWVNTLAARTAGARGLFRPRIGLDGGAGETPSLYDGGRLVEALPAFLDFDRLNAGEMRCIVATTDVETGETVLFDTAAGHRIGPEHLLASGGLMPAFPAVRIGERLLADGGLSANAPLEPFLSSARREPVPALCFLIELFAADGPAPRSLEAAAERASDLKYATQTLLRLEAVRRERALEARLGEPGAAGTDLLHLSYHAAPDEAGSEKPYDFSRSTIADRMQAGRADAEEALRLLAGLGADAGPGLRIHRTGHRRN